MEQTVSLFGSFDENIKLIESQYNVKVISRGSEIKVSGDAENVSRAVRAINGLLMLLNRGEALSEQNVRYVLSLVNEGNHIFYIFQFLSQFLGQNFSNGHSAFSLEKYRRLFYHILKKKGSKKWFSLHTIGYILIKTPNIAFESIVPAFWVTFC